MLPAAELDACMTQAGFEDIERTTWDKDREFEEWMGIVNDPTRAEPLRTVVRALAEAGRTAGMGLSIRDGRIVFFHRWRLHQREKAARTLSAPRRSTERRVPLKSGARRRACVPETPAETARRGSSAAG